MAERIDEEMLKNLDLLMDMDSVENEDSWEIVENIEEHESESEDKEKE